MPKVESTRKPRAKPGESAVHLSTETVRKLEAPEKGSRLYLDDEIPGFGCQVTYSGTRTFRLRYRKGGTWYSIKLGRWHDPGELRQHSSTRDKRQPGISATKAREQAAELRRKITAGENPGLERRLAAAEQVSAERGLVTVTQAWHGYCGTDEEPGYVYTRGTPMKPGSIQQARVTFKNHVEPYIGRRAMSSITSADIEAIVKETRRAKSKRKGRQVGGPSAARHTIAHLSAFFAWALKAKIVKSNVVKELDRGDLVSPAPKRERYLNPKEFEAVLKALDEWPYKATRGSRYAPTKTVRLDHPQVRQLVSCEAFRVGLFTAARKGEVYRMKWADIDLEDGWWRKPAETMKAGEAHEIALSRTVVASLRKLKKAHGDPVYVFPGKARLDALLAGGKPKANEGGPITDAHELWGRIRDTLGLEDVTIHDLRHSAASVLISHGHSLHEVGQQLSHKSAQTTMRYAHLFKDRKKAMSDTMDAFARRVTNPQAGRAKKPAKRPSRAQ